MLDKKFFLTSLTVWGVIVTFATTAWPVINSFMGWDVGPEVISKIGADGASFIQAGGALFGTVMVLVGRFRAKTALKVVP